MKQQVEYVPDERYYIFFCPHCESLIQVLENEVNCQIFRHAVRKSTGEPVNPHLPKEQCDSLVEQNLVYGCCKPFKLIRNSQGIVEHAIDCEDI